MLEALQSNLATAAGIVGSLITIFSVPFLRRWAIALAVGFWRNLNVGAEFAKFQTARKAADEAILSRLENIEHEVQVNGGGSMKDFQLRQESYRRHDFWAQGRPAMELDGNGGVILVSEAACRLFQVSDPEELYRLSWLRFMESGEVDELLGAFRGTAAANSIFRYTIEIIANNGDHCGRWEFRAVRIVPDVKGQKLYSGHWTPIDTVARAIADRHRWAS